MATTPIIIDRSSGGITTGKIIGGAAILIGVIYIGKKIKNYTDKIAAGQSLKTDQESTITPPKGKKILYDLSGKPITSANLATIAADLENALSYPVDGQRAVRVFRTTPFGYVKELEKFYLNKYGENLKDRMISRLSDSQWIAVKYNFR
jgi:hypothetical protein